MAVMLILRTLQVRHCLPIYITHYMALATTALTLSIVMLHFEDYIGKYENNVLKDIF